MIRNPRIGSLAAVLCLGATLSSPAFAQENADTEARKGAGRGLKEEVGVTLSRAEVTRIIDQAKASADRTASAEGLRSNSKDPANGPVGQRPTRMVIAVVARDGAVISWESMPDAWVGSRDIAIAKARTAAFFSSDQNALTSRVIGELSQPAADGKGAGPLWGIWASNQTGISGAAQTRNGIITFPGGVPLYKDGKLVGGIGVSGDAVDQDEVVAFAGAAGFEPGPDVTKLKMTPPSNVPQIGTADAASTASASSR